MGESNRLREMGRLVSLGLDLGIENGGVPPVSIPHAIQRVCAVVCRRPVPIDSYTGDPTEQWWLDLRHCLARECEEYAFAHEDGMWLDLQLDFERNEQGDVVGRRRITVCAGAERAAAMREEGARVFLVECDIATYQLRLTAVTEAARTEELRSLYAPSK